MFTFSEALEWLKKGKRIFRTGWDGADKWLAMHVKSPETEGGEPVRAVYAHTPTSQVAWSPIQADLLADDWSVLDVPVWSEPQAVKLVEPETAIAPV